MNFPKQLTTRRTRGYDARVIIRVLCPWCLRGQRPQQDVVLRTPENGLIALNVPMDSLRLGALNTRLKAHNTSPCSPWRPIPMLVRLGQAIDSKAATDFFQCHRDKPQRWARHEGKEPARFAVRERQRGGAAEIVDTLKPPLRRRATHRPIKRATASKRRYTMYRVASAIAHQRSIDPGTFNSLADIVEPDAAEDAGNFIEKRSGEEKSGDLHGIARTMHTELADWLDHQGMRHTRQGTIERWPLSLKNRILLGFRRAPKSATKLDLLTAADWCAAGNPGR